MRFVHSDSTPQVDLMWGRFVNGTVITIHHVLFRDKAEVTSVVFATFLMDS